MSADDASALWHEKMRDCIPEGAGLDFTADFADDGCDCDAVSRVLEEEIAPLGPQYGLRNNYEKMVVYPMAGERFTGDLSKFVE